MKIMNYRDIESQKFDAEGMVKGVTGRVAIGKQDGAKNFCMRVFEIEPGGFSPRHSHEWEHEIFFHQGKGQVYSNGDWLAAQAGTTVFIPILSFIFIIGCLKGQGANLQKKSAGLFLVGYLVLVLPWNIYASYKRHKPVIFSDNWENVLLDTHNEDSLVTGKWEPSWRKEEDARSDYFYNRADIQQYQPLKKFTLFVYTHKKQLPRLYWRKLLFAFGKYPPAFYATVLMCFYFIFCRNPQTD